MDLWSQYVDYLLTRWPSHPWRWSPADVRVAGPVERAFLDAITAAPGDTTNRLVFADWLEDQGDKRAEFVRLDCALRRQDGAGPDVARVARWWTPQAGLSREWRPGFGPLFAPQELPPVGLVEAPGPADRVEVGRATAPYPIDAVSGVVVDLTVVHGRAALFR